MKTIYLIETHPTKKNFFTDISSGWINETNSIKLAKSFNSYKEAQKVLHDLVTSDYESADTLYLSIVSYKTINY